MIGLNKIKGKHLTKGRAWNEGKEANWGRERNERMKGETKKAKGGVGKKNCIRVRGGKEIMRKIV